MIKNVEDFCQFDFKGLSNILNQLSPIEFAALSGIVGIICSIPLNSSEQNVIGNFLEAVGQIMLVAQAQNSAINNPSGHNYVTEVQFAQFKQELNSKLDNLLERTKKY